MNSSNEVLGTVSSEFVIHSKRAFTRALDVAIQASELDGGGFSVLDVCLDNLTLIHDALGQTAKSKVLRRAAIRLIRLAGARNVTVARHHGNRFLLLVRGNIAISRPLAIGIAMYLSEPVSVDGHIYRPRCTVGVSLFPDHGSSSEVLRGAAIALGIAQDQGGGQVVVYDPAVSAQLREEALLVLDLSQAARNGELTLYFQPKIDTLSMQVVSVEALLRWRHPKRGNVSPAVFVPLAEKHHLMQSIGTWVFQEACLNAAKWLKKGLRMRVSVNLVGISSSSTRTCARNSFDAQALRTPGRPVHLRNHRNSRHG